MSDLSPAPAAVLPRVTTLGPLARGVEALPVPRRHAGAHRLAWVTKGGGRVVIDGVMQGFGPQTLLFLPEDCIHAVALSPGSSGWVATLAPGPCHPLPAGAETLRLSGGVEAAELTHLLSRMAEEQDHARPGRDALLAALAVQLSVTVLRMAAQRPAARESAARRLLRRFVRLIEEQFRSGASVEAYAAALGITPTHLSRICRSLTGRPASAHVQDRVFAEAQSALRDSTARVGEIARSLGFADPAYFTRLFVSRTGRTPTAFRALRGPTAAPAPAAPPPGLTAERASGRMSGIKENRK